MWVKSEGRLFDISGCRVEPVEGTDGRVGINLVPHGGKSVSVATGLTTARAEAAMTNIERGIAQGVPLVDL